MKHRNSEVILASCSPRRRELLKQIGVRFTAIAVDLDETLTEGEAPDAYVRRMAAGKSLLGRNKFGPKPPVLGADTVVVLDGEVMGKPQGRDHALDMLTKLSGCKHQVLSAVSIRAEQHWQALSVSSVWFRDLNAEEILDYWASGEPLDKAGGYAIQGLGAKFVKRLEGSFSGVVGLPLFETSELLQQAGISVPQRRK